jgi:hypothetical protein
MLKQCSKANEKVQNFNYILNNVNQQRKTVIKIIKQQSLIQLAINYPEIEGMFLIGTQILMNYFHLCS